MSTQSQKYLGTRAMMRELMASTATLRDVAAQVIAESEDDHASYEQRLARLEDVVLDLAADQLTMQDVEDAVVAHVESFPRPEGRPADPAEIAAAVALYMSANREQFRGPRGFTGAQGEKGESGDVDDSRLDLMEAAVDKLVEAYAGDDPVVRMSTFVAPTLKKDTTTTYPVAWSVPFPAGSKVSAVVVSEGLVGRGSATVTNTSLTGALVSVTTTAAVPVLTGTVVAVSR